MQPILECIPNFSEGQNPEPIARIAEAIEAVAGVHLLHLDAGFSANRTVVTFAGTPEAVVEAAFQAMATAAEVIDMRQHTGTHPRMGATDVCPLVPVQGMSMQAADALARRLGQRVGEALGIPIYLYEASASSPRRRNLAHIRSGQYEGFREKILQADWVPDFGPQRFHERAGQTAIGARDFLIAYNINLDSQDVGLAQDLAAAVRESGRWVVENGKKVRRSGPLKGVKAIGWEVEEYELVQVSTNVTNIAETPVHEVFEAVKATAADRGVSLKGSELIGMAPLRVFTAAGAFYAAKTGQAGKMKEAQQVALAIQQLGLASLSPFLPESRILEYALRKKGLLPET